MINDYKTLIENYIFSKISRVLKQPYKAIQYPFIDPGEGYEGNLWDWDSYFTARALLMLGKKYGESRMAAAGVPLKKAEAHAKGCVQNFLSCECADGYVPVMMTGDGDFCDFFVREHLRGEKVNQMKPFLCQAILNACEFSGDFSWFDKEKALKYLEYYEANQRDEKTGLFFWQDDIMIGIDNNPTVFFRPPRTCADIYLNTFMALEYEALQKVFAAAGDDRAADLKTRAEQLKNAINEYLWDERDGIYYSGDLSYHKTTLKAGNFTFHENLAPTWKIMPMRVVFWGCFLPLYAGIADKKKAEKCIARLRDETVFSKYGIRTLASNEPMYNLEKTSNPSNWLGAIWGISNYCVWKGLKRYGEEEIAKKLQKATIELYGKNLKKYGEFFESYQPDSGEPNLNPGFLSWNLLIAEMLAE